MNIKNKITQTPETLGANLTKQAQDLYPKNGTILMKETKALKTSRETFYINGMGDSTINKNVNSSTP